MTAQFHEKLILEGKATSMAFCPPIPTDHPDIAVLNDDEMRADIAAGRTNSFIYSTACWRQYIGTWELKAGRLYLTHVEGRFRLTCAEPIFADWVTAILRIPDGELLRYVHMGFGSVYEFETHLKIEQGIVVDERRIDNRKRPHDPSDLGFNNLPGKENRFPGDDW